MPSNIDFTKPIYGTPTTQSVRDNFEIAQQEITNLQAIISPGPFMPLAGGLMTGPLTLSRDPFGNFEAATKQYVDNLAFGDSGSISDAPKDGMFYARGGALSVDDNNEWESNPLFSAITIGADKDTPYFGLRSDPVYNFYDLDATETNSFRWDRNNLYLSLLLAGSPIVTFSSSVIAFNVPVAASLTISAWGGVNFGDDTAPGGPTDLTRHISLWGGTFGFSVSDGRLNYLIPAGAHTFMSAGQDIVAISDTGIRFAGNLTAALGRDPTAALEAATKQYVDLVAGNLQGWTNSQYLPLAGGTLGGQLIIRDNGTWSPIILNTPQNSPCMISSQSGTDNNWWFGAWSGGEFWLRDSTVQVNALTCDPGGNMVRVSSLAINDGGGLRFGQEIAPGGPIDLTRHINLWGSQYGFSITGGRLNYVALSGAHIFVTDGNDIVTIDTTGIRFAGSLTATLGRDPTFAMEAATKQYVDSHVAALIARISALETT